MSTNNSPLKAVIYTRVSTETQEDNSSLAAQFVACQKKAADMGAEVVAHLEEVESGGLYLARPKIQKALKLIEAGAANILIVMRLDRTGRDVDDLRDIRRRVAKAGGQMVFADGLNFQSGAVGDLMFTQLGAFAEFERALIRERTVNGLRAKAAEGKQVARARFSYGYKIWCKSDAIRGDCKWEELGKQEIIEGEALVVREMFERCAAGDSLNSIVQYLLTNKIPTKRGGVWTSKTVSRILQNASYKGVGTYGKKKRVVDETRDALGKRIDYHVAADPDTVIKFKVPEIVSEDLWNRVQVRLGAARKISSGNPRHRRALTGLLRCPHCNSILRSIVAAGYRYYRCYHAPTYATDSRASAASRRGEFVCSSQMYNESPLLEHVQQAISILLQNPSLIAETREQFRANQKALFEASGPSNQKRAAQIQKQLEKIEKKEAAAAESRIEAKIDNMDTAPFDAALRRIASERRALEDEAAQIGEVEQEAPVFTAPQKLPLSALKKALDSHSVSGADKHKILSTFIEAIYPYARKRAGKSHDVNIDIVLRTDTATKNLAYVLNWPQGTLVIKSRSQLPSAHAKSDERHEKERWKNPLK